MRRRLSLFQGDTLALESIEFQRDQQLFKELTNLITEFEKIPERDIPDHELALTLPAVIKAHTGLQLLVSWAGDVGDLACCPPVANPNHVFWNRLDLWIREAIGTADADKILSDPSKKAIGTVDLKRGKVGGVFSEMACQLLLPAALLVSRRFTAAEKAAGILHELGHLFSFFEYLAATMTSNFILQAISKTYDTPTSVKDREVILTKIKSQMKMKELDAEALAKSNNRKITEIVLISTYVRELRSEIGSNIFDINGWEVLADQFAARQGAARDVTTFLDKLYREHNSIKYRSWPFWLYVEAMKIGCVILAPLTLGSSLLFTLILCLNDGVEASDTLYGTLKTRYGRMRDQLVAEMKVNKDLDRQAQLAQDIQVIDDVLNGFTEKQQLLGYVYDFLSPVQRKRISQEKLQRQLEDLAHNDLFVRSAALKQLGA
jgi:hypothetical protein